MTDDILQQQIAYYRARAGEYDEWFYRLGRYDHGDELNRQWFDEVAVVMRALHALGPLGSVLELAAGTGNWTRELVKIARQVTAIDASPEMIAINREKVGARDVVYRQADLFVWEPDAEYDLVFFGFWLSHVPPDMLDAFLDQVRRSVSAGGQVFLVDSRAAQTSTATDHAPYQQDGIYHTRKLNDGREFTILKIFYEPAELQRLLDRAGFEASAHVTEHYFIYAQGIKRA